jgi:hypothetical protein
MEMEAKSDVAVLSVSTQDGASFFYYFLLFVRPSFFHVLLFLFFSCGHESDSFLLFIHACVVCTSALYTAIIIHGPLAANK